MPTVIWVSEQIFNVQLELELDLRLMINVVTQSELTFAHYILVCSVT